MLPEPELSKPPGARLAPRVAADLQVSLLVASQDLDRLQRLLSDATETLMGHFYGASQQINHLSRLAAQHPDLPRDDLHLAQGHLSGAVTTLQFQDMASQLIHHTHQRLRHCVDRLAREGVGDDKARAGLALDAPLRPNPVTQAEMDAGSIELF